MYSDEQERSRIMGYVLGGIAAGVLVSVLLNINIIQYFLYINPLYTVKFGYNKQLGTDQMCSLKLSSL